MGQEEGEEEEEDEGWMKWCKVPGERVRGRGG